MLEEEQPAEKDTFLDVASLLGTPSSHSFF
jgi:hypothetical protein